MKFGGLKAENLTQGESLPVRGAWIEIDGKNAEGKGHKSLPVRGAWIEIR